MLLILGPCQRFPEVKNPSKKGSYPATRPQTNLAQSKPTPYVIALPDIVLFCLFISEIGSEQSRKSSYHYHLQLIEVWKIAYNFLNIEISISELKTGFGTEIHQQVIT